jgi:hypothetical protein
MKLVAAAILVALAAVPARADPGQTLDMLGFFTGKTHADNVIAIALHGSHKLIVDSVGGRNKQGEFILIDDVQEEGKPARKRTWAMHAVGANHFTGSLTDAAGPVDVVVAGNTATIRYVMKDGNLQVEQRLTLQPNGTLSNTVMARKFGFKFATVQGTVRKLD